MIDLDTPGEVAYWVKWLGAPEADIREAIRAAGPAARKVKLYLLERNRDPGTA